MDVGDFVDVNVWNLIKLLNNSFVMFLLYNWVYQWPEITDKYIRSVFLCTY